MRTPITTGRWSVTSTATPRDDILWDNPTSIVEGVPGRFNADAGTDIFWYKR